MSAAEMLPMIPLRMTRSAGTSPASVGGSGVGFDDREGQSEASNVTLLDGDVRRVDLDEGSGHSGTVLWAALLERAENVVALTGA